MQQVQGTERHESDRIEDRSPGQMNSPDRVRARRRVSSVLYKIPRLRTAVEQLLKLTGNVARPTALGTDHLAGYAF